MSRAEAVKLQHERRTPEEKAAWAEKIRASVKARNAQTSQVEKDRRVQKQKETVANKIVTSEEREARSLRSKQTWENMPEEKKRERNLKLRKTEEQKAVFSQKSKAWWDSLTPEEREQHSLNKKQLYLDDPEYRLRVSAGLKCKYQDPKHQQARLEANKKISETISGIWQTEEFKQKIKEGWTEERRLEASRLSASRYLDSDYRLRTAHNVLEGQLQKRKEAIYYITSEIKIQFMSSWELEVFKILLNSKIVFQYNPSPVLLTLNNRQIAWHPDFALYLDIESEPTYLEVKGHPKAAKRWYELIVPAIKQTKLAVLLLDAQGYFSLPKEATLTQLINNCSIIGRPHCS